jgi:hypothetical protein
MVNGNETGTAGVAVLRHTPISEIANLVSVVYLTQTAFLICVRFELLKGVTHSLTELSPS